MSAERLIHLIYISSATSWPTDDDLTALLEQARTKNARLDITGMLVYSNATYMQVLEGGYHAVHEVFDAISVDPRNTGVVKLLESNIEERDFPKWSMGFRHLDREDTTNVPGFVDIFNGKLDKTLALGNRSDAIKILISFARDNS